MAQTVSRALRTLSVQPAVVAGYGHPQLSNLDTLVSDAHLLWPLDAIAMTTQIGSAICLLALRRPGDDGPAEPTPRVTLDG